MGTTTDSPQKDGGLVQHDTVVAVAEVMAAKPTSWGSRISAVIWDRDDKSDRERKFVQKLDMALLTSAMLSYFCKYLNQANISNAYASGMKEALHFKGNQYNTLNTMFVVGYLIGQIPGPLMMVRISPSIWLPAMEILWSIFAMCCAAAKNVETLYGLRFLIGLAEATAYPGTIFVLGSWYTPSELGKRSVIFICSSSVGTMFSGYLQAAVLNLDGVKGLQGYQWLFIMDGIISICIAVFGFFMLPDVPERPNPRARFWLKNEDIVIAQIRMERLNRAPRTKLSWSTLKLTARTWVVWAFFLPYAAYGVSLYGYQYMNLWLKAEGYSTSAINLIPTGGYGVQIAAAIVMAWFSDATRSRPLSIMVGSILPLVGNVILACWPESKSAKTLGFYLAFTALSAGPLILVWINELLSEDAEVRVLTIGITSTAIYVFSAWVPNLVFPASEAPVYRLGYKFNSALIAFVMISIGGIWLFARTRAKRHLVEDHAHYNVAAVDADIVSHPQAPVAAGEMRDEKA